MTNAVVLRFADAALAHRATAAVPAQSSRLLIETVDLDVRVATSRDSERG